MLLVLCGRCGDIAEVVGGYGGGDLGEPAVRYAVLTFLLWNSIGCLSLLLTLL
jgi:hypothetical protein